MFHRKKDKELDYASLNELLAIGSRLAEIFYIIAIIAIVLLATYLVKEWGILSFIGEFFRVISPIFIGFLIAWLFDPAVRWLQKKKVPRVLGCILVYLLIISGLFLLVYLLVPTFIDQIKEFAASTPDLIKGFGNIIDKFFSTLAKKTDLNVLNAKKEVYSAIEKFSIELTTNIPSTVVSIGTAIVNGGIKVALGLMIGFYMLFDYQKISKATSKLIPVKFRNDFKELGTRLNNSLRSYIQGLLLVMLLVFITQSIGLTLAGLNAPLIFALFCALTDVIPYFGPYIGAIPAVLVGFMESPLTGIACIIAIFVVQQLENNFYEPLIMGHTMKLHPVTIMIGLLLFEHFFGIIGMIVATPVIASAKIILTFIDEKLSLKERIIGKEEKEV